MSHPRKPGQPHKGWKKANKRLRDRRHGKPAKGLKTSAHARKICIAFDDKMFDQISLHQREAGLGSFGEAVRALMSYAFDRLADDDMLDAANEANRREFEALFRQPVAPDPAPGPSTTPIGLIKTGDTFHGCDICTMPGLEPDTIVFVTDAGPAKRPPPTTTPQPESPPATGGEARSSGITDDAPDDAGAKTRDS